VHQQLLQHTTVYFHYSLLENTNTSSSQAAASVDVLTSVILHHPPAFNRIWQRRCAPKQKALEAVELLLWDKACHKAQPACTRCRRLQQQEEQHEATTVISLLRAGKDTYKCILKPARCKPASAAAYCRNALSHC
jgi:hypothetical protein